MPDGQPPPAHPLPVLRSERIYLRPAERADLPDFVRWFADAETTRHLALRAPFSLAMEEKWFEGMVERQGKSDYHFVICLAADGRAIGTAGLHGLDLENGHAEFGISIGEKGEWSRGYGTEALNAICDFGFGALRLERIDLHVNAPNLRAQRSYRKAGFQLEGTLRNAQFAEGRHEDVLLMSLLRQEWQALPRPRSWDLPAEDR
ncbi:MAG: GNAT family N-acetyltransferase [Candidatus Limnocylindria bacterium]